MNSIMEPSLPQHLEFPEGFQKSHFASEIASDLFSLDDILKRHYITKEHLSLLTQETEFNMMLEEYKREWGSPLNVRERIKLKAALATEDGLEDLYLLFRNNDLAPNARLDAFKQITSLADAVPRRESEVGGGSGFSITINVGKTTGEEPKGVVIEGSTELDPED